MLWQCLFRFLDNNATKEQTFQDWHTFFWATSKCGERIGCTFKQEPDHIGNDNKAVKSKMQLLQKVLVKKEVIFVTKINNKLDINQA